MTSIDDQKDAKYHSHENAIRYTHTGDDQANMASHCHEQLFAEILNDIRELVHCVTSEGRFVFVNSAWLETMGYSQEDVATMSFLDIVHDDSLEQHKNLFKRLMAGEKIDRVVTTLVKKSGMPIRVRGTNACFYDQDKLVGVRGVFRRVTGRKGAIEQLPEACVRLDLAMKGADLGVWDWNIPSGKTFSDPRWATMLGYSLEEIEPKVREWEQLIHPDDLQRVTERLNDHLAARTPYYESEHRVLTKSGEWRWVLDRGKVFERDVEGKPIRVTGTHLDITERKRAEQILRELSLTDDLTSLRNRRGFLMLAKQHLKLARRGGGKLLVVYADVDGLKQINDKFGHAEGSLAIAKAAELLQHCFRDTDIVARLGGDEFAVLAIEAEEGSEEKVLKRIEKRFEDFNKLKQRSYYLSLSVGSARANLGSGETIESLLSIADSRMYDDKRKKSK